MMDRNLYELHASLIGEYIRRCKIANEKMLAVAGELRPGLNELAQAIARNAFSMPRGYDGQPLGSSGIPGSRIWIPGDIHHAENLAMELLAGRLRPSEIGK